jgi:hypothetical protein
MLSSELQLGTLESDAKAQSQSQLEVGKNTISEGEGEIL